MSTTPHPIANPQLEISPLDSDAAEPMAVCELPAREGRVRYAVPAAVVELVRLFDGRRSVEEALAAYVELHPGYHTEERLKQLVEGFLLPKGLVLRDASSQVVIERSPDSRRSFLYVKLPLLGARVVDPLARALGWAYSRPVALTWLLVFVWMHVYFYSELLPRFALDFNELHVGGILILMLLSTIGTFIHELGHASAAAYYGCKRMEIGWGLYLIFTVFYTDVSDAWKLPRKQRAVVDLGGIYFQSFFLAAMLGLFAWTGNVIYLFGFLISDLAIAGSFNPFLRLDGYWLMSDLFGILNLRQQSLALVKRGGARLLGLRRAASEAASTLSRKAMVALIVYSVLGGGFFLFLSVIMIDRVVARIIIGFPHQLAEFWLDIVFGAGALELVGGVVEIVWRGLMLAAVVIFFFRTLKFLVTWLGKLLARFSSEPTVLTPDAQAG